MHQPVQNLYHEQVHQPCTKPVQNMYHEQVHQPCTKPVQITCITTTCPNNLSQQPVSTILSTKSDQYHQEIRSTHQDNSQRCASTNHNTTTHNHHQDQYVLLIIYQYKYATSSINHVSTILLTSASNHVPSMYQSCITTSTMTHQDVPTSSTIHLMYVPTHQLLVSTMYPTCTSTKSPHQFHHPNMICNYVIDLVYMITYLQTFLNFNNKRLAFSSNFTLVSHD
jgi:hypothetical protein